MWQYRKEIHQQLYWCKKIIYFGKMPFSNLFFYKMEQWLVLCVMKCEWSVNKHSAVFWVLSKMITSLMLEWNFFWKWKHILKLSKLCEWSGNKRSAVFWVLSKMITSFISHLGRTKCKVHLISAANPLGRKQMYHYREAKSLLP